MLVGTTGKFHFPGLSPIRWWKQEEQSMVFVDRYLLQTLLIDRATIRHLSTFETLIVVPKNDRTGRESSFRRGGVRVNGQGIWQMSQQ